MVVSLGWEGDWPVSQFFGENPRRYARFGFPGHEGIDIATPEGTRCRALYDGVVVEVGTNPLHPYGYYAKLRTHDGADILWCHLLPYDLRRPGTSVGGGDPLGWTGNSGNSTGPHLHLGYRPRWWERNPPWDGFSDPWPVLGVT